MIVGYIFTMAFILPILRSILF